MCRLPKTKGSPGLLWKKPSLEAEQLVLQGAAFVTSIAEVVSEAMHGHNSSPRRDVSLDKTIASFPGVFQECMVGMWEP